MLGEARYNGDRNFQEGDCVTLIEGTQHGELFIPTGRTTSAIISCIDTFSVPEGFVSLSYDKLGILIVEG